jgi:membrane protease YdiL (CAAX protease family)
MSNPIDPETSLPQHNALESGEQASVASEFESASPNPIEQAFREETEREQTGPVMSPLSYVSPMPDLEIPDDPTVADPAMFETRYTPDFDSPVRIPHLGHVAVLSIFAFFGLLGATLGIRTGIKAHLYGVTSMGQAVTDIHFTLGSELILYLFTFILCLVFFPMIWQKGFFAGIQWNGQTALRLRQRLFITAAVCFALALINGLLLPGPEDAPIDKIFKAPGAAWLLFGFGITIAPFFEEMVFRGFLLPALCTACDWVHERFSNVPIRPLDETGQPRWSVPAMVIASICTSLPFAGMHAAQTGYSFGPFILLVGVSLALCWARLSTRSLAASVMVHASYNFLLFSLMMFGTEGFKHLDKM